MIVEGKKWQIEGDLGNTTEADIMLISDIYLTDVSYGKRKKRCRRLEAKSFNILMTREAWSKATCIATNNLIANSSWETKVGRNMLKRSDCGGSF